MTDVDDLLNNQLNFALEIAENAHSEGIQVVGEISESLRASLDMLSSKAQTASTVFTNIVTALAIKAALPEVDVRYHQTQIQNQTDRAAGFNFRGKSESVIYPWLSKHAFEGAKSGFQARTLERPKPYNLSYDENIGGGVKKDFLNVFDRLETHQESASAALSHLLYRQVQKRELAAVKLSVPKTQEISDIIAVFNKHFFYKYKGSKGASRLPVLALHSIYSSLVGELRRYDGKLLLGLQEHSAADSQTGSLGDIEVSDDETGEVFEAVEVKHGLPITASVALSVRDKVRDQSIRRYYVLTTLTNCEPEPEAVEIFRNIRAVYDCQVIANGLIPTMKYYLRLLCDPSSVFAPYVELLKTDKAIGHEHRSAWNEVVEQVLG